MKLSVIIIICDTDYTHLPELLKQVDEHVFIEHEVIVIDNRVRYKNEKLCIEPAYSFGYNAYQFAARSKALEYANGEYVWFIDGDDNIIGDIKEEYTEDIIAFSFNTAPQGDVHLTECVRSGELFTYEQSTDITVVLWNKLIKRKLFTETYSDKLRIITTNEDTIWLYTALKQAKTLRIIDEIKYEHVEGTSNKYHDVTLNDVGHLLIGHKDMKKLIKDLIEDTSFYRQSLEDTYSYLLSFVHKVPQFDRVKALRMILSGSTFNEVKESLSVLNERKYTKDEQRALYSVLIELYGRGNIMDAFSRKYTVTYANGTIETIVLDNPYKDLL